MYLTYLSMSVNRLYLTPHLCITAWNAHDTYPLLHTHFCLNAHLHYNVTHVYSMSSSPPLFSFTFWCGTKCQSCSLVFEDNENVPDPVYCAVTEHGSTALEPHFYSPLASESDLLMCTPTCQSLDSKPCPTEYTAGPQSTFRFPAQFECIAAFLTNTVSVWLLNSLQDYDSTWRGLYPNLLRVTRRGTRTNSLWLANQAWSSHETPKPHTWLRHNPPALPTVYTAPARANEALPTDPVVITESGSHLFKLGLQHY